MRRVVVDTNVYVSALHFGGLPAEVLEFAQFGLVDLFVSRPILDELRRVLVQKLHWQPTLARGAVANVLDFAYLVEPLTKLVIVTADDADNRILECAVEAQADVIVSGDRHLIALGTFQGIEIVTARTFVSQFMGPRDK